ncbi:futalosine hydrolase [Pedobacter sp. Du54]|uniref:futalosine hydrolase n=1 Tax=Pedobacter anseongensis TaxID=3133439 RepID=UPI0030B2D7AE
MTEQTNKPTNQKTLVVAATYEELLPTFSHFGWPKANFVEQPSYDVLITGVGITATAFALGQRLNDSYGFVLNVGIAGSFNKEIELGSLVNITEDTFSEFGAEDGHHFIPIDELGFGKSVHLSNLTTENNLITNIMVVKGITVNTVHGNADRIKQLLERLPVSTESMEGAAVFYACEQLNIPAVQIRSISNYIEQRNRESWKVGLAIKNLNEWLITYLNTKFTA